MLIKNFKILTKIEVGFGGRGGGFRVKRGGVGISDGGALLETIKVRGFNGGFVEAAGGGGASPAESPIVAAER